MLPSAFQPTLGVGSAATLAVRIGTLVLPGNVVISQTTAQLVSGYFSCNVWEETVHVGTDEPHVVYEVRGESAFQTRLEVGGLAA